MSMVGKRLNSSFGEILHLHQIKWPIIHQLSFFQKHYLTKKLVFEVEKKQDVFFLNEF